MNKAQRKREAREKKARAKAAKKARKTVATEPVVKEPAGLATAQPVPAAAKACAGKDARTSDADKDVHTTKDVQGSEKPWYSMTQEELVADPELLEAVLASQHRDEESFDLADTAREAEHELKWARGKAKEATAELPRRRRISDQRALEMLEDAAEATHEILLMVRDALRGVSPERREAAREVLNAKPQTGVDGRKLPRRAPDPVVTLERLNLQAASLLKRILAKTNPDAGKKKAA
ncbi:MAG: hypothetical protein K8I27_03970 [Planctomycetes bacterium]|nr:hypothetical protein [Planctomycetota bacterium]